MEGWGGGRLRMDSADGFWRKDFDDDCAIIDFGIGCVMRRVGNAHQDEC